VGFWQRLAVASQRLLALDYDGTLAPFTVDRDQAWPYPGVQELLGRIAAAGHTRVVIVSGRGVDEVLRLLKVEPALEIWGSHGHERRLPDRSALAVALSAEQQRGLRDGRLAVEALAPREAIEIKPACLAVHWRGKDKSIATLLHGQIRKAWEPLTASGLSIHDFDGGIELRSTAADKGTVMNELLSSLGSNIVTAYLGDDLTDEDAFHALEGRGLSVLVRPEYRATSADVWLRPPGQLLQFLETWHTVASQN
jgi:trehalose-phosphatase